MPKLLEQKKITHGQFQIIDFRVNHAIFKDFPGIFNKF